MKTKIIILLFLISFWGCKKETIEKTVYVEQPQDNLIIWTDIPSVSTKPITVEIKDPNNNYYYGIITTAFTSAPNCFTAGCFTLKVSQGNYVITAVNSDGSSVWGPTNHTINASTGCNNLALQ